MTLNNNTIVFDCIPGDSVFLFDNTGSGEKHNSDSFINCFMKSKPQFYNMANRFSG